MNFTTANFSNFFCRILKLSYIFCLGVLHSYTETNWMNSTSREICGLNNRRGLWAASVYLHLPSLCLEVCLSFAICLNISLPFIQLLLFEQDTSVFNLTPIKVRNILQHIESRSSFGCSQNIKEEIFTELEPLLCFKTKRNET